MGADSAPSRDSRTPSQSRDCDLEKLPMWSRGRGRSRTPCAYARERVRMLAGERVRHGICVSESPGETF
jgi:hypothetical protein